ncbi:hypothetical protein C1H46_012644 [Malus baccata]|uniref:Factor of DNA methylation 1-5/IDN2 domain-containing protein n=1 Tax=Malus baccata TaxID=106549 RepID=A0A540MTK7_MALBA|nr:hypothetical protein C1H46_012644 [Malus baccata]
MGDSSASYIHLGLSEMLSGRSNIGIKRMGDLDQKPFMNTCKERFTLEEAQVQASTLCSLWQDNLTNPDWHPFKIYVDGMNKFTIRSNLERRCKAESSRRGYTEEDEEEGCEGEMG